MFAICGRVTTMVLTTFLLLGRISPYTSLVKDFLDVRSPKEYP